MKRKFALLICFIFAFTMMSSLVNLSAAKVIRKKTKITKKIGLKKIKKVKKASQAGAKRIKTAKPKVVPNPPLPQEEPGY